MRDHLNTQDFNEAVRNLPFIGFRTRMDLAFKVTHEQLFAKAGGKEDRLRIAVWREISCPYKDIPYWGKSCLGKSDQNQNTLGKT